MGIILEWKKPISFCSVPKCGRKHYARSYCEKHYKQNCRSKYRFTWDENLKRKLYQKKKEDPIFVNIKNKTAKELYMKLKELNITTFRYKDIMDRLGWGYENIKKYTLKLIKLDKIQYYKKTTGGKAGEAIFKVNKPL